MEGTLLESATTSPQQPATHQQQQQWLGWGAETPLTLDIASGSPTLPSHAHHREWDHTSTPSFLATPSVGGLTSVSGLLSPGFPSYPVSTPATSDLSASSTYSPSVMSLQDTPPTGMHQGSTGASWSPNDASVASTSGESAGHSPSSPEDLPTPRMRRQLSVKTENQPHTQPSAAQQMAQMANHHAQLQAQLHQQLQAQAHAQGTEPLPPQQQQQQQSQAPQQPTAHTLTPAQQATALAEQTAHRLAEQAADGGADEDDDEAACTTSKMKRGHGASCHQCKTTKDPSFLFFCTNKAEKGLRKRRCRKKYCDSCLKRSYGNDAAEIIPSWQCPSCLSVCICAACHRKVSKKALAAGEPPMNPTAASAAAAAAAANHHSQQQQQAAEAANRSATAHDGGRQGGETNSPDPLSMLTKARSTSCSSSLARISLSPLTISRGLSTDSVPVASSKPVGESMRLSPRFSSRSLATGKGNSRSNTDLAALDQQQQAAGMSMPLELDPFLTQSEELERLMIGMNMQQRQSFLHDATHLSNTATTKPSSTHASPRASPRSIKRKVGAAGDEMSPTQHVKYNMQQRVKNHFSAIDEVPNPTTLPMPPLMSGLPPPHSPAAHARRMLQHNVQRSSLTMSTPSSVTHLPDEHLNLSGGSGAGLNQTAPTPLEHAPEQGMFSPPTSMFTSSASDLMPGQQTSASYDTWKPLALATPLAPADVPHVVKVEGDYTNGGSRLKSEPEYLQWGGATPNPSFLSPLPGSLLLNFPLHHGAPSASSTMGLGLGSDSPAMGLFSPNPIGNSGHQSAFTPGGYASSSGSSGLFSPNPSSSSPLSMGTSPSPYGSGPNAMAYPPLPAAEAPFALRQLSEGGQNTLMGETPIGGAPLKEEELQAMWNQDSTAWRQTSANVGMSPTPVA